MKRPDLDAVEAYAQRSWLPPSNTLDLVAWVRHLEVVAEAAREFIAAWDRADFHDPPGDKADELRAALEAIA